jgi:hypothetical protein
MNTDERGLKEPIHRHLKAGPSPFLSACLPGPVIFRFRAAGSSGGICFMKTWNHKAAYFQGPIRAAARTEIGRHPLCLPASLVS